jgi:hypothetical protein
MRAGAASPLATDWISQEERWTQGIAANIADRLRFRESQPEADALPGRWNVES